jgi:iron complex outermembrane receptor protein
MNMEEVIKILLEWGFKEFPARKDAVKSFGYNYCDYCKKGDVIIDLGEDEWVYFEIPEINGSYEFSEIQCLINELKDYGIIHKPRKPKSKKIISTIAVILFSCAAYSQTLCDTIQIPDITVSGNYNATKETPFTFKNVTTSDISLRSTGCEPGVVLSYTPSITVNADNGASTGYVYYRLRGIDQTRINVTLNGIPMNEPEDEGIYFNNFGGFLNAISNIQIIRGAGLSKPGVSSYGGSINFNSLEFSKKFSGYAEILNGSYNTLQLSAGINTPNFFVNVFKQSTDGFKDNSFNKSYSVFYGGKIVKGHNEFKLYGFASNQKNGMAWLGAPLDSIKKNPRYNSNFLGETDNFEYTHNQLSWSKGYFKTTVYYTWLAGYYDTDMSHFYSFNKDAMLYRIRLQSNWVGTNINWAPRFKETWFWNFGVNAFTYSREHHGSYSKLYYIDNSFTDISYANTGIKNEVSPYAKMELKWFPWTIYGDIQYRYSMFKYDTLFVPNGSSESVMSNQTWKFLNWSAGVSCRVNWYTNVYYGIGVTHREPTRYDMFNGNDFIGYNAFDDTLKNIVNIRKPETAINNELGFKYEKDNIVVNANIYYMKFKNEFVFNGIIGDNSLMLHETVKSSIRSGVEIDAKYTPFKFLVLTTNNSISYNRIYDSNLTGDTLYIQQPLSPAIILQVDAMLDFNHVYVGINRKYVSEQYMDLANKYSIPAYRTSNLYAGIKYKGVELKCNVNNLGNKLILTSGNIASGMPTYFVMAKRNYSLALTYNF